MQLRRTVIGLGAVILLAIAGCGGRQAPPQAEKKAAPEPAQPPKVEEAKTEVERVPMSEGDKPEKDIQGRLARFAPTKIDFDDKLVPDKLRPVVKKLVEAAQVMDDIFLIQVDPRNPEMRRMLGQDPGKAGEFAYFDIMAGPWDRLDGNKLFMDGPAKPPGAGFYPADMTKDEFNQYIQAHPNDKEAFEGYFTVIRRKEDHTLVSVPYSVAYKDSLDRAAALLNEAAALTKDKRLRKFLGLRAQSFATNEYRKSDMAWMDLGDGAIEFVIGPYEVYEDEIFGYKAAFEAFLCIRDTEESNRLARVVKYLPELEKNLPMPPELNRPRKGQESPVSVVEELFTAGNARAGVQTLAFNLPNDEKVREAKGSKKVMLKNVAHAKFDQILIPIAKQMMVREQVPDVSFNVFFNHSLMHEMAHGLGPGLIKLADGTETDVNKALRDVYPIIEEAKADLLGLWATNYLIDKKLYPSEFKKQLFATFLGGFFRSVRFGATEAHGRANAIQFNYLFSKGGVEINEDGLYRVNAEKALAAVEELSREILTIEAKGDYDGAKRLIETYGTLPEHLTGKLAILEGIPVDIRPEYTILEKMKTW